MTPRGFRERRPGVIGLGLALGLALVPLSPGPSLAPVEARAASAASSARHSRVPTLYHKSRSFRIPFNVDPADRPRLRDVQLWCSKDAGYTWDMVSATTPDRPAFTFRASRDGEYWFAVRTLDIKGQLYPREDEDVEPSMKVVVDSTPPRLVLEPDGRRGSLAAVRWDVKDEHLDLKSLMIEYQVEAARDWRQVPIRRLALLGEESWDAGTAAPLKVRASVRDKADNVAEEVIAIPEGTPTNPGAAAADPPEFASPPPVSRISSGTSLAGPDPSSRGSSASANDPFPFPPQDRPATPSAPGAGSSGPDLPPFAGGADPFNGGGGGGGGGGDAAAGGLAGAATEPPAGAAAPGPGTNPDAGPVGEPAGARTIVVSSPQFPLKYDVEDAGPDGPARVELWVTRDGGRTWRLREEDTDRVTPFPVNLGGEGTFGLRLVARAASGLGDPPPRPGDPPDTIVEVDSTPPTVQLLPPQVGTGPNLGKVTIRWRTSDLHPAPTNSVMISWRPDQTGAAWRPVTPAPVDDAGVFVWDVPATVPARFHLRVAVVDSAKNLGSAETSEGPPVIVDRTRPRSRIIGLDPSARNGTGPSVRALR